MLYNAKVVGIETMHEANLSQAFCLRVIPEHMVPGVGKVTLEKYLD